MFDGLGIIGLFSGMKQFFKESTEVSVPAENWNNKDLLYRDKMDPDISSEQIMKNIKQGKYYSPTVIPERHEQHKPIVDKARYERDVKTYGKSIADDNAKQGLYSFILK